MDCTAKNKHRKITIKQAKRGKYHGVNNHIGGSLNLNSRQPTLGDFTWGEIQPTWVKRTKHQETGKKTHQFQDSSFLSFSMFNLTVTNKVALWATNIEQLYHKYILRYVVRTSFFSVWIWLQITPKILVLIIVLPIVCYNMYLGTLFCCDTKNTMIF